jgi:DNA-directed RNA polymerase specialized sigma24 family protein
MAWGREAAGGVRVFAVAADAAASAPVSDVERVLTVERRHEAAPTPPLHDPVAASTVRPVALAPVAAVESQEAPARATGEVAQARAFDDDADDEPVPTPRVVRTPRSLPMTRADCEDGIRPCPYVSCRHHLLWVSEDPAKELDEFYDRVVVGDNGEGLLRALAALPETCVLDVADRGELTYEDVAEHFGVTRERIRQIVADAVLRVRYSKEKRKLLEGLGCGCRRWS